MQGCTRRKTAGEQGSRGGRRARRGEEGAGVRLDWQRALTGVPAPPFSSQGWPEVMSREVLELFHRMIARVYVALGQSQGKTLLPLPPSDMLISDRTSRDKDRVHVLETAVVTWTSQIKSVLKNDPEAALASAMAKGEYPGPRFGLEFWQNKEANLRLITQQLESDQLRKVMRVLELTKSPYYAAFAALVVEVGGATAEARDNVRFLSPLKQYFEDLATLDNFEELPTLFKPIMHLLLCVWKHSRYYNTPPCLAVIMCEICNDLVEQARKFVTAPELFAIDSTEAVQRLTLALRVCEEFKSTFYEFRAKSAIECPDNPWQIQVNALFSRLDAFLERCYNLLNLCQTITQFLKLERVDIGGNKGEMLTTSAQEVYRRFMALLAKWQAVGYDVLDVNEPTAIKSFEADFFDFMEEIKELEQQLASILTIGLADAGTVQGAFKLIDSFGDLLLRDFITSDIEAKNLQLIYQYGEGLKEVQQLFSRDRHQSMMGKFYAREGPPLYTNMPPVSGALAWVQGLMSRMNEPHRSLKHVLVSMQETDEAKDVQRLYESISAGLNEFEAEMFGKWGETVEATSAEKLSLPLLTREARTGELSVNFDPMLVKLLCEVKYFVVQGKDIPAVAQDLYSRAEKFRVQRGNLEIIRNKYNEMLATMLDVEKPLLKGQMKAIDKLLEKGLKQLAWNSSFEEKTAFIDEVMGLVVEAHVTLTAMKDNMEGIKTVLKKWADNPLITRKQSKTYPPLGYVDEQAKELETRYKEMTEGGKEIHSLLLESNKVLRQSKGAPAWRAYVEFINNILIDGIAQTVTNSLRFLLDMIDPAKLATSELPPLLEVKLKLEGTDLYYDPPLDVAKGAPVAGRDAVSIIERVNSWISDFYNVVKLLKRLDRPEGDFLKEMEEHEDVRYFVHRIITECELNQGGCKEYRGQFLEYKHLWNRDIGKTLEEFLETALTKTEEGADVPDLKMFDERIAHYKETVETIKALPDQSFQGWLKVDSRPIKSALGTWAGKWAMAYMDYLQKYITTELDNLIEFIASVNRGLTIEVEENDTEQLVAAMTHVRDVKVNSGKIDKMFEPLRSTIGLLKNYNLLMPDEVLEQLENVPFKWEDTKKTTMNAREMLGPLQSMQQEKVKEDTEDFRTRVADFVKDFHEQAPFAFEIDIDAAYASINEWNDLLNDIEVEAKQITEGQELFEVAVNSWKELKVCRQELLWLKTVWDHVQLISDIFSGYKATLWSGVNVDAMMDETKKLQKEIKGLPRQSAKWEVVIGLVQTVNDMAISLPLVQDLRDDAMRERHWQKLMSICGKTFIMDAKLQLDSLLQLQLHKFADAVSEVVEQSRAEIKIDLQLQKIMNTWTGLILEYNPFKATGVNILLQPGEVFEALDDNEVALQNMSGNRFVGFFETQVNDWKGKLGMVRTVLDLLLEVQRAWCSLESIFLGSEDIREQLPEDAKRFDGIDAEFREQMAGASANSNPIEVCTEQGREEAFNKMQANLDLCQKSLSDYLEVKKKRFPRFYFISAIDLVDILSKGRNPPMVQEHFSKFTDATGGIEWKPDEETGKLTGVAMGCTATDGEKFDYPEEFACEGAVEDWLTALMAHQEESVRVKLLECVNTYVEVVREKWVDMFIAQFCITAGQVWWTTEVNSAFDRLEQGNEGAMKEYLAVVQQGLSLYTSLVLGKLSKERRVKVKTLITIDVHARDIVIKLINDKVENALAFAWQAQLKYRWDEEIQDCFINICDAEFRYAHEYVGNPGRLVITALTDRCYITLTQALRLILGGAPAGPAGTGKTETTKDLGRGLAVWVIVMNCSDQMTSKVTANIFSGLAQTGAWGCFDEFNRIAVEVLSVVAGQYAAILDAIKGQKTEFIFEEETINLQNTVGAFITMNPGYAGRTELPENLKALFRPCAMVVPDFENIAEINLAGEGFQDSKALAHKFVELFSMCKELLSKQYHYDWGLRAMTGVLRIAGGMKRDNPDQSESQILMRALRDTNLPKFVAADFGIFRGLIDDLFPRIDAPRQEDAALVAAIKRVIASETSTLQPETEFVIKITNLKEMLGVRHCVFVLGCAGSAKTELWKTLADAQTELKEGGGRTLISCLNPKAVTSNDLYGYVHPVTKEPYDGIIAKIMRDFSKSSAKGFKWVVLDGDIDAEWIESMNTVMDDNKVLTLVSNERIPLTGSMRMIFEISHLRNASPATVSRAGVIFLNEYDVGWRPYVQTWVEGMGDQKVQTILDQLFDQFVAPTIDIIRREKWKYITPIKDFAMVQVVCRILEGLLTPENCPPGSEKEVYEAYFQFATIWALGGAFGSDKGADFRKTFDAYWRNEYAKVALKFPEEGSVFDYFIDPNTKKGEPKRTAHWRDIIPEYKHDRAATYQTILVPTLDTTRIQYLSNMLLTLKKPVMLVGNAGSAKTVLLGSMLRELNEEHWMYYNINFNSMSEAVDTQFMLEAPLEKKTGSIFGPPGSKRLVYFVDDINMPTPDKYGTQSAIALMRQQVDYGGFYDLKKLTMKKLENVTYVAAMNPTAGSFFIIDRMQRHFATIATPFPESEVLAHIYSNIMEGHLQIFSSEMRELLPSLINAAVGVHQTVADQFLPTAIKFHYQWNLRAMANVFQGLINMNPVSYKSPVVMARLWAHETQRVYGDRMVNETDVEKFNELVARQTKAHLGELDQEELTAEPNLFANFVTEDDAKFYLPITKGWKQLSTILEDKLAEYNDTYAQMNLVLFNAAMEHVCRISRIIANPRGNAMLVGVGGSGKQSLTRLASFIANYEVFQMKLTATYNMNDFKEDLRILYTKVGVKSIPHTFLFTDQQIFKEICLVYLNDILSSGVPPDLFNAEDKDNITNAVRNEAKAEGYFDSKDSLWEFYVTKVRKLMHVVCCMSPVGDTFRNRCRRFPALTNCTSINWFFAWPEQALISVAQRFLEEVEMESDEIKDNCARHMAFVHESVGVIADLNRQVERREVYTTPKSFLELIALYKDQLAKNRAYIEMLRERLSGGLVKLHDAQDAVAEMQVVLAEEQIVVEQKKKETDALLEKVGQESIVAEEQAEIAAVEEEKVSKVQEEVGAFQESCLRDLAAAEPAIKKAEAALDGLDKKALTELKSLTTPPADVLSVTAATMYMIAPKGTNLKKLDVSWAAAKKMMGSVDGFLQQLQDFDKDGFLLENKAEVRKYTGPADNPNASFTYTNMVTKSGAAAGLCDWIVNICIYHDIYLDVEPKRQRLGEAQQQLADANKKLTAVRAHVQALEDRKAELSALLEQSTNEKNELIAKAERTQMRANLAQRLVNGLKDEGVRWTDNVATLDEKLRVLVGDVMVSSSFIAYIAPFNAKFRAELWQARWMPDVVERKIPSTDGFKPMDLLTDASTTATWRQEGLPADPLSTENASIIVRCARFPLVIDPQLQAIEWIQTREEPNGLIKLTLGSKNYLDKVARAMEEGLPLLIENMGESIDAVLDNMVARAFTKKGSKLGVKLGDRDCDVMVKKDADGVNTQDPAFRLYMQTKLPNPHYIPEIQAQTTVVNFTVTEKGLEDQLLATVVGKERPDLLEEQLQLVLQQNEFTIKLKQLEDDLLHRLATAEGDILSNEELIIALEDTKATVKDINAKVLIAQETELKIAKAFESYRVNANRGSLIYFLMNQLNVIDHMYQFSLAAFNFIFNKALDKADASSDLGERVKNLQESITYTLFAFVTRGLFERHRLIFSTQLAIKVSQGRLNDKGEPELSADDLQILILNPRNNDKENPVASWLPDAAWGSVQALVVIEDFASLPADIEGSWKRWKEWTEHEQPEAQPLPQEWKRLSGFRQLMIMRALRPDRMTLAITRWVGEVLGEKYMTAINFDLPLSFEDSGPAVPVFFLLSPGVNPDADVQAMGKGMGKTEDEGKFIRVSLGQGQEPVAEKALDQMYVEGGWVMLANIELVAGWLPKLEKKLEALEDGAHPDFRVFLSAMPQKVVPVPILQKSIKLTNEPPSGLKANLLRAYLAFDGAVWENSSKQSEFKAVIFALCFFHSVVCERRKFGPMGWNRGYPFNQGDLVTCISVANNYLEAAAKIPWADLRYLFGEIMYGGHITDNWDRRLCNAFQASYVREELVEGIQFFPGFASPPTSSYKGYQDYIEETIERETPAAYGLHPNSEINFMTRQADDLFASVQDLQPRGGGGAGSMTAGERAKQMLDDILEKLPEMFVMMEIEERIDERTPYTSVFLQECERMNGLLFEIGRSLRELDAGLRGDLSISEPMEVLMQGLVGNKVPDSWTNLAYPSLAPLGLWLIDMIERQKQLQDWTADLATPKVTWISGLFNPQAFLTAVMQVTARKNEWALDKVEIIVDVTKKGPEEIEGATREGAYIHGLFVEGARWDSSTNSLEEAFMKELYPKLPVMLVKAAPNDKVDNKGLYVCPCYKTQDRGPTFVFAPGLKSKEPSSKWVMAGVALLMSVVA